MSPTIEREAMVKHLESYRNYLRRLKRNQDGADTSVYEFAGAIRAVNSLIAEVKKGKV